MRRAKPRNWVSLILGLPSISVAAAESNRKTVASQSHAAYIAMLALGRLIFPFPAPNAIGVSYSLRTVTWAAL